MMSAERRIFQRGSKTYFWSSFFFPRKIRQDVIRLYSFVRIVDDMVDQIPQDKKGLNYIERTWRTRRPRAVHDTKDRVLRNIIDLANKHHFEPAWVDAFLRSMRWDVSAAQYKKLNDSLEYVYGSAEVIGLMMAKVLDLSDDAAKGARLQGRAMQWINFCRDVDEDLGLGRCYFPASDLRKFKLPDLSYQTAKKNPRAFARFMMYQLDRYEMWQAQADGYYQYIPRRLRVPIRTASSMYRWTAKQIREDPFVVYRSKVKPHKWQIFAAALKNSFSGS